MYGCAKGNMATLSDGHPSSDHDLTHKTSSTDPFYECMGHLPLIGLNMICCPQSPLIQKAKVIITRLDPLSLGYLLL